MTAEYTIEYYAPQDEPPYEETGWYVTCRDEFGLDWEWGPFATEAEAKADLAKREPAQ